MSVDIASAQIYIYARNQPVLRKRGYVGYAVAYVYQKHRSAFVYRNVVTQNRGKRSYREIYGADTAFFGKPFILFFKLVSASAGKNKNNLRTLCTALRYFYFIQKIRQKRGCDVFVDYVALENGIDYPGIDRRPARKRARLVAQSLYNVSALVAVSLFDGNASGFFQHHSAAGNTDFSFA